jgi:hypothetical protein
MEDKNNPLNGETIDSCDKLLEIFSRLKSRPPFLCELQGSNGYNLIVGIGYYGCVQHSPGNGDLPYLVALARNPNDDDSFMEFLCGGTPTPIARRFLLPFDVVEEIAVDFQKTGEPSALVSWEEI